MKTYETYKDSGIEWLGQIPGHWEVEKLKYLTSCNDDVLSENTPEDKEIKYVEIGDVDSVTGINGYTLYKFKEAPSRARRITKVGDIIISTVRTYLKAIAAVKESDVIVSTGFAVLRPQKIASRFLANAVLCKGFIDDVIAYSTGVSYPAINASDLVQLRIPVPPISEQEVIASYLDYKIGQVDLLIAEKEKQMKDLQQYRMSLISETVTHGLNPDVKMKESGVEWLGRIPEHWVEYPLKRYAHIQTGSTPSTERPEYWDNPNKNWFTPSDFTDSIMLHTSGRKVSELAFFEGACRVFPANTVLVVGIGATLGKVGMTECESSANQQINAIVFNGQVVPKYGAYYFFSQRDYLKSIANAATLPILNQNGMKELHIPVPPLSEQQAIASFLDEKTARIDSTLKELETQIADLRYYKTSVITETVTGKVDVRQWKQT